MENKLEINQGKEEQKKKIEYKYLFNLYPNEKGPDYELIKIIEEILLVFEGNFSLDNIVGLDNIKNYIQDEIIKSLSNLDKITNEKIKDVLLYGAPGTGKTFLVKSLSKHKNITFLNFHPANLISQLNKEKEKIIKIIFDIAKFYSPSILFIDEIDILYYNGEDKVNIELLNQIENISSNNHNNGIKNIIIIAATNRPWKLNDKILKKFQKKIYVPLLKEIERKKLFEIFFENSHLDKDINFDEIDKLTEGFTGADIYEIYQDATYEPIRKKLKEDKEFFSKEYSKNIELIINNEDIIKAIKNKNKSIRKEELYQFKNFKKEYEEY